MSRGDSLLEMKLHLEPAQRDVTLWNAPRAGATLADMGKARRDAKLERRSTQQAITEDQKFNWKTLWRRVRLVFPRVLLVVFGMLLVQIVGARLGIKFLSTSIGQLVIFGVFYVALFRWIYAPMLAEQQAARALSSKK